MSNKNDQHKEKGASLSSRAVTMQRREDSIEDRKPMTAEEGRAMKKAEAEKSRLEIKRLNAEYAEHRKLFNEPR